MTRRLLFVHAHPDDEASKGAGAAARYADEGARVVLVTCTGGEAGEVLNPNWTAAGDDLLPAVRRSELDQACAIIGFTERYDLGFHDSGYHEDPAAVPPGVFASLPVDEVAAPLAAILRSERPQVVVTYPEDGGYPHPDHVRVHVATMRALELAEDPAADLEGEPWRVPKVSACSGFPVERIEVLHAALRERGIDSPFEGWGERRGGRPLPPPCDALVEVADWFSRRDDALRAHATQVDPAGFWFQVPRELERERFPWDGFWIIRSDVDSERPEADLFAGLAAE